LTRFAKYAKILRECDKKKRRAGKHSHMILTHYASIVK